MMDHPYFISVGRFSKLVSLSERTCWSLIRANLIPVHRIGRRVLSRPREGFDALEDLALKHPRRTRRSHPRKRSGSTGAR